MPVSSLMSVMSVAEFFLWALVAFLFWKKNLQHRFPAMNVYLLLRVGSMPVLLGLLYVQSLPTGHQEFFFPLYFGAYWLVYIASAVTLYFVTLEIFRTILSSLTGLIRLGNIVFRWAAVASLVFSLASISFAHPSINLVSDFAVALMRSVSVLELCLLGFLCMCMNTLKLSTRELAFGFALGIGIMQANDFILAALVAGNCSLNTPLQVGFESAILLTLGIWAVYCALPEPARKPVVMAANSTIYRWNEIAAALGHGTQVAVAPAGGSSSFFLSDVERVVEKVLTRNLAGNESKS
jgi:hypothetical protein